MSSLTLTLRRGDRLVLDQYGADVGSIEVVDRRGKPLDRVRVRVAAPTSVGIRRVTQEDTPC